MDRNGIPKFKKEFKRVGIVVCPQYCDNNVYYDIMISWIQKSIRRGNLKEALYCAYHIYNSGGVHISHMINRLILIASEDIGIACKCATFVYNMNQYILKEYSSFGIKIKRGILKFLFI